MESILNYEIFAYKQSHNLTNSDWKKVEKKTNNERAVSFPSFL